MVRSINDPILGDAVLMKQSIAIKAIHTTTNMPAGIDEQVLNYMRKARDPKKRYKKYLHAMHPSKVQQPDQRYFKTASELKAEEEAAKKQKEHEDKVEKITKKMADLTNYDKTPGILERDDKYTPVDDSSTLVVNRFGEYYHSKGNEDQEMIYDEEMALEPILTTGTYTREEIDEAFGDMADVPMRDGTTTGSYGFEEVDEAFGGVSTLGSSSTSAEVETAIEITNRVTDPTVYRIMPNTPVTPLPPPQPAQVLSPYDEAELEAQSLDENERRSFDLLDQRAHNFIDEVDKGTSQRYDMNQASGNLFQQTEERANRRQERGDERREGIIAARRGFDARVNDLPDDIRRMIVEQATANTRPQNWADLYNDQDYMDTEDL